MGPGVRRGDGGGAQQTGAIWSGMHETPDNARQARATPPQTIPPASLFSREGGSPVWVPAFAG